MLKGFILIIAIVIFALLTVLSIVFSIIYFASSKKGRFIWLSSFFICLIGLISSVYILTNSVVNKISSVSHSFENSFRNNTSNPYDTLDTNVYKPYSTTDEANNQQISFLKSIEPENYKNNIASQFYSYLGFRDYYRLPLRYPFSLHCIDSLGNASLFNELEVIKFDESNNGEIDAELYNITEFTFDRNILLAKHQDKNDASKYLYVIYNFENGKLDEYPDLKRLILAATKQNFSRSFKFYTCKKYFESFE
jgi:hypothetical protein